MDDPRTRIRDLVLRVRELHATDRRPSPESLLIMMELERMNAGTALGLHQADFAKAIGLTVNQYWKRVQAARLMLFFPRVRALVAAGEISVSVLSMLTPKLTQANQDLVLGSIKGRSKREIEQFLATVTPAGSVVPRAQCIELRIQLNPEQVRVLELMRVNLACGSRTLTLSDLAHRAIEDLIEKHAGLTPQSSLLPRGRS